MARAKKDGVYSNVRIETLMYKKLQEVCEEAGQLKPPWLSGRLLRILRNMIGRRRYCGNMRMMNIYIQAKQWAPDRRADRQEIQKFAGALQGEKATKGLFITTAKFSTGAEQYARNLHGSMIVLIDGTQLMKLMIKFNVGVSVDHVYEVKRIDTDFFNEGL